MNTFNKHISICLKYQLSDFSDSLRGGHSNDFLSNTRITPPRPFITLTFLNYPIFLTCSSYIGKATPVFIPNGIYHPKSTTAQSHSIRKTVHQLGHALSVNLIAVAVKPCQVRTSR